MEEQNKKVLARKSKAVAKFENVLIATLERNVIDETIEMWKNVKKVHFAQKRTQLFRSLKTIRTPRKKRTVARDLSMATDKSADDMTGASPKAKNLSGSPGARKADVVPPLRRQLDMKL